MARPAKEPRAGFDPFKDEPPPEEPQEPRYCGTCRFFVPAVGVTTRANGANVEQTPGRCFYEPPKVTLVPVPGKPTVAHPQGEMSMAPITFRPVIENPLTEFCVQHARADEYSHAEGIAYSLSATAEILERILERATDAANRPPGS